MTVIYSLNTTGEEREAIEELLLQELSTYVGIEVRWPGNTVRVMSEWVEKEVQSADTVLCVCNPEFQQEWAGQDAASSPVACFRRLLTLCHHKTAVVLLLETHRQCIPTDYLRGDVRSFYVNQHRELAHFITGVPELELRQVVYDTTY